MGSALILPGSVDASPFGKFHEIEGTFDSTVALIDFGLSPLTGIPGDFAPFPNLMRNRMAEVSGLPLAQCDITTTVPGGGTVPASGVAIEITEKGALHVASTQAGGQTTAGNVGFSLSAEFANWLLSQTDAGADYAVLMSMFMRCTRAPTGNPGSPQSMQHIVGGTAATTNLLMYNSGAPLGYRPSTPDAGYLVGRKALPVVSGNADLVYNTSQGWAGTKPADLNNIGSRRLAVIGAADAWAGVNFNLVGSYILYRAQLDIIDLTDLPGADRAAKANATIARLQAMATRDLNTEGGRFYGDTFTPAATLRP